MARFEFDPTTSCRVVALECGVSQMTVWHVLKRHNFKPFKIKPVQKLHDGDDLRRVEYCHWVHEKVQNEPNFLKRVMFTDETLFSNCGMFNRKNSHWWSVENTRQVRERKPQIRFGVNVWMGILGK